MFSPTHLADRFHPIAEPEANPSETQYPPSAATESLDIESFFDRPNEECDLPPEIDPSQSARMRTVSIFRGLIEQDLLEQLIADKGEKYIPTHEELQAIERQVEAEAGKIWLEDTLPPEIRTFEDAIIFFRKRVRIRSTPVLQLSGMI